MKDDFKWDKRETPTTVTTGDSRPPYAPVELSMANAGIKKECEHLFSRGYFNSYGSGMICGKCGYDTGIQSKSIFTSPPSAVTPQGTKYDTGKPDLSLVSSDLMTALAEVRQFGAAKYSRDNWKLGFKYTRSIAAALRHIMAFKDGEDTDSESGLTHIAHAIASLEHLLYDYKHRKDNDDRKIT